MGLTLATAATFEPATLAEAKNHLRVDGAEDDALIALLITSARQACETIQRRSIVTQVFDLTVDDWPADGVLVLPNPPLVSVGSITYLDSGGSTATLSASSYRVIAGTPGRVVLTDPFPSLYGEPGQITVRFTAGYASASAVPAATRVAILLLVGHHYANRETVVTGAIATKMPMAYELLTSADDSGTYA